MVFIYSAEMLEVSLQPKDCICPSKGYTCHVNMASEINWNTNTTEENTFFATVTGRFGEDEMGGFRVNFTFEPHQNLANFTSTLLVTNIHLNETDVSCEGRVTTDVNNSSTTTICIVGMSEYFCFEGMFTVLPYRSCIITYKPVTGM